jgi:hypothetical protein
VETVNANIADGVQRNQPEDPFKEAKQAVDLIRLRYRLRWPRIKEQKNIELAKALTLWAARLLRRAHLRLWLASHTARSAAPDKRFRPSFICSRHQRGHSIHC